MCQDMSSLALHSVRIRSVLTLGAVAVLFTGCGAGSDPLNGSAEVDAEADETIVVGSQAYYSNEIIAEIYAQALEAEGFEVDRQFQIGQREVYLPELEAGQIDLLPEYTGNLVQYYESEAVGGSPQEVYEQVQQALPDSLQALDWAEATDQDSYTVTAATAQEYGLESIGDLTAMGDSVTIAANSEFEARPYGPAGALEFYGVTVEVIGVEDSGGPLTVGALIDGSVDVADIYTSSPAIAAQDLVILADPEHLILPQNIVPVASSNLDEAALEVINEIQSELSLEALIELNTRSIEDQSSSAVVAEQWLQNR